jgi:hypothetical protein
MTISTLCPRIHARARRRGRNGHPLRQLSSIAERIPSGEGWQVCRRDAIAEETLGRSCRPTAARPERHPDSWVEDGSQCVPASESRLDVVVRWLAIAALVSGPGLGTFIWAFAD